MPPPYDSVVSIGGQSFVDGFWRMLGPALEGLTNPVPIPLPGFSNAQFRVRQLVPSLAGPPPAGGGLAVEARVELTAEALLHVLVESGTAQIALGSQNLSLTNLAGPITLPPQSGSLSSITLSGGIGTLVGTGDVSLPGGTATLAGGTADGELMLPPNLALPGVALPAIVPVPVDLTAPAPMVLRATVPLTVAAPSATTRFGIQLTAGNVSVPAPTWPPSGFAASLEATLQAAVQKIVEQLSQQLGVAPLTTPPVNAATVDGLIAPVPDLAAAALGEALTALMADTGRLTFPAAGGGASCDVKSLPMSADVALNVANNGTYVLQVGFARSSSNDISGFPPVSGPVECEVLVGNRFLLSLLCCLVERLPSLAIPGAGTPGTTDVEGNAHVACCNFFDVSAKFAGIAIGGGGLSVCLDGEGRRPKSFSIIGRFSQEITGGAFGAKIADVRIRFKLPVRFDIDDAASIANLRLAAVPEVTADVDPSLTALIVFGLLGLAIGILVAVVGGPAGWIAGIVAAVLSPVAAIIIILLVQVAAGVGSWALGNAARTLLSAAALLRSPAALPPGLFEAFGKLAPATVRIDDLDATGVLHTPTSVWGLLPRLGPNRRIVPPDFDLPVQPVIEQPQPGAGGTILNAPGQSEPRAP